MKRVFIIHGWDGHPEEGWFPWLKHELEARGFEVRVPALPDAGNPRIENWVPTLSSSINIPDSETYLVGHSMGCQTIARYLEKLSPEISIGGAVFVAGYFKRLTGIEEEGEEVVEMAHHWLDAPIDLEKVKVHLPNSVAIFSDNDPYVPSDNQDDFKNKLGSKIIIEHNKGHFSGSTGTVELSSALEAVLEIAGEKN